MKRTQIAKKFPQYYCGKPYTVIISKEVNCYNFLFLNYYTVKIYKGRKFPWSKPVMDKDFNESLFENQYTEMVKIAFSIYQQNADQRKIVLQAIEDFMTMPALHKADVM